MSWVESIPPAKIGMPEKFGEWRAAQAQAIEDALSSDKRFVVLNAPLGMGKSGIGCAVAMFEGSRAVYLTSTKALQAQLESDGFPGMSRIEGRSNYQCAEMGGAYTCDEYSRFCKAKQCSYNVVKGHRADCSVYECLPSASGSHHGWSGHCPYKRAYQDAMLSKLVNTNYSYWLSVGRFNQGLGDVDILICDEAHAAPDEVCRSLATTITHGDLSLTTVKLPDDPRDLNVWPEWSKQVMAELVAHPITLNSPGYSQRQLLSLIKRRGKLAEKCQTLTTMHGDWVVEPGRDGWSFEPVWPYQHAEKALFRGIPKVILMSGTITRKTMALLGVKRDDYDYFQYPYVFPKRNNPVYHVKSGVINKNTKPEVLEGWYRTIGNILRTRSDRKGIVHTVSYRRADEIKEWLDRNMPEVGRMCLTHESRTTQETIRRYKSSRQPVFLLSPSVTTGYDFPGRECEFVVLCKLPFPMTQSAVMKARQEQDKLYSGYLMVQDLVQSSGRGMRSATDRCEVFVLDDSWFWASRRYQGFIPPWFRARTVEYLPKAPMSIEQANRDVADLDVVDDSNTPYLAIDSEIEAAVSS
jgi:ATP-dependent DNA helicase DinG